MNGHSRAYCLTTYVSSHVGQLSLLPSAGWEVSTSQGAVALLHGCEGNNRSGIPLATCHHLWYINLQAQWPKKKRGKHPAYSPVRNMALFTGSIARSASLPVFSLLRGRFWGFSPRRGDTLHRWGWNFLRAKFHPHRWNDKGVGPPKLKFLLRFDQNVEYKRPAGAYPLRDFHKFCRVCTLF